MRDGAFDIGVVRYEDFYDAYDGSFQIDSRHPPMEKPLVFHLEANFTRVLDALGMKKAIKLLISDRSGNEEWVERH
ncbi:hypothetical protein TGRH88_048020 [Toxoplasma gondii]|uniref:Uncharacterized protein n=1 Tax=Toxoplasma gondii TaxID=5811 RepID=A0A7J6K0C2_TOXGO|nr:hypothetical protein TGRH88_048020 [Toxoplasma gondii]